MIMPKVKDLPAEVVGLVRARLRKGRKSGLVEWAALGLEERLEELYERFQRRGDRIVLRPISSKGDPHSWE